MEQTERITQMEQRFDRVLAFLKNPSDAPDGYLSVKEDIDMLEQYYGSDEWKQDFADDEAGKLPDGLKRGVLSEDGLWNLLSDYRELQNEEDSDTMIEGYLEKPYWVIDILPRQVAADSSGQFFRVEEYYREPPQIDAIHMKFTHILLKLNCYEDLDVSQDGEVWNSNPAPKETAAMVQKCLSDKKMLYVILKSADAMITINSDDTYMTVYHPSEELVELLGSLAASEGLFLWKPTPL